jgi:hypothetical protein
MKKELDELLRKKILDLMLRREELLSAFIAKFKCEPDDIVLCEMQTHPEYHEDSDKFVMANTFWARLKTEKEKHIRDNNILEKYNKLLNFCKEIENYSCNDNDGECCLPCLAHPVLKEIGEI